MQLLKFCGSCGTYRCDTYPANVAHVVESAEKVIEERGDAIRAGENKPVVRIQAEHRVRQIFRIGGRTNFNGRNFEDVRSALQKILGKFTRLFTGARYDDS